MVLALKKTLFCIMETSLGWGDLSENTVLQKLQTDAKLLTRSVDWTAIELLQAQQLYFPLVYILMSQH